MKSEATQFTKKVQSISKDLQKYSNLLNEERIALFQNQNKKLNENLEAIMEPSRTLKIGIVGEVKAGKSSFINALIFDGKDILPKAPTPMTAALTKICYGETFEAEIVFYDQDDWGIIQQNAEQADQFLRDLYEKYEKKKKKPFLLEDFKKFSQIHKNDVPKEYAACKELIEMAKGRGQDILDYIGKTEKISSENQEEYIEMLNNYVGADGHFTPIVKYSIIKFKKESLKGIEIVDTPGMNDPIVSRTMVTSDFLLSCDVVFFLSYAGQFLSHEEMSLLTQSLPENSINHAYLIASKFDSALLDYKENRAPLQKAAQHTLRNLHKQSENTIAEYTDREDTPEVIKAIKENLPPHPISGMLFSCAVKIIQGDSLNEEEEHILKQLEKRFLGFERTPELLLKLANINNIEMKYFSKVKDEKNSIIAERSRSIIMSQKQQFLSLISDMKEQVIENIQDVQHSDVSVLKDRVDKISTKLYSIEKNVKDIFILSASKAQATLNSIKIDLEKEINNHVGMRVDQSIETKNKTRRAGFLGLRKEHYTVRTEEYTVQITEVISRLRKYITKSREMINDEFKRLFDLQSLKKEIVTEVIGAFDLVEEEFNELEIKRALELSLNRIVIQDIVVNQKKYDEMITSRFSSLVKNEEIHELSLVQEQTLSEIASDLKIEIDKKIEDIDRLLKEHSDNFITDIKQQIQSNADKIEELLKNKEQNLEKLRDVSSQLDIYKLELTE